MRTSGTFNDVYQAARDHHAEVEDTRPMDPVVRHRDGKWHLESGLGSAEGCDFQCDLEAWDNYFYESYKDVDFDPSESDEADFVEAFGGFAIGVSSDEMRRAISDYAAGY